MPIAKTEDKERKEAFLKTLSTPMKVALEIFRIKKESKEEIVYYSLLKEKLGLSPNTLSYALDNLVDSGIITAEWKKNKEGRWVRSFNISGEAGKPMEQLYIYLHRK